MLLGFVLVGFAGTNHGMLLAGTILRSIGIDGVLREFMRLLLMRQITESGNLGFVAKDLWLHLRLLVLKSVLDLGLLLLPGYLRQRDMPGLIKLRYDDCECDPWTM